MELLAKVEEIFKTIDRDTEAFAQASGIRCRAGCGECCYTSLPEARVIEMLPLAHAILEREDADSIYERARENKLSACIFYAAKAGDPTLGQCSVYEKRPGLCRLFGFAAVRSKAGSRELAACHWHKKLQPEAVEKAKREITSGILAIPAFYQYDQEFWGLEPSPQLSERLPINQALVCALEYLALPRRIGRQTAEDLLFHAR